MSWGGSGVTQVDSEECSTCGAPRNQGLVACSYCDAAYPGAPDGVSCPACGDDNRPHQVECATCGQTLLRGCIFCGAASSVTMPACSGCGEAFAGAAQRKSARDSQQRQQQMVSLAGQGLSVLGQVATNPSGRGLLNQVWQEVLRSSVKK